MADMQNTGIDTTICLSPNTDACKSFQKYQLGVFVVKPIRKKENGVSISDILNVGCRVRTHDTATFFFSLFLVFICSFILFCQFLLHPV